MKLFSGVPDPIPRIVTRFSKPAVFVACKPGTVEFRLVMVFAKDLSRESADKDVIAYCRIAERSSHSWFVLRELLGYPKVRNYDGSWTEWGSFADLNIATGDA